MIELSFHYRAIDSGVLSNDPEQKNYAGKYMYMYTDEKGDAFKHIQTRCYLFGGTTQ